MGSAILAWALDARWDISMGGDERVSALVEVEQNIDYLRSGAVTLDEGALFDAWSVGDGTIAVSPLPPVVAGSEMDVTVTWPGAGGGRGGRLELQADVKAPNSACRVSCCSRRPRPERLPRRHDGAHSNSGRRAADARRRRRRGVAIASALSSIVRFAQTLPSSAHSRSCRSLHFIGGNPRSRSCSPIRWP